MAHEILKRTIWVALCTTCGERVIAEKDPPPKERFCSTCNTWVPFQEESYTGPSLKA